jgi:hypothetical protein
MLLESFEYKSRYLDVFSIASKIFLTISVALLQKYLFKVAANKMEKVKARLSWQFFAK